MIIITNRERERVRTTKIYVLSICILKIAHMIGETHANMFLARKHVYTLCQ